MLSQIVLIYLHWIIVVLITGFLYTYLSVKNRNWIKLEDEIDKKYDYIVVGGGSAGAIVASRLSEDPNISVLLLEAGIEKWDFLSIPALGPFYQLTEFDWQYETIPQKQACYGLKNKVSKWPSGKVLGGTTHLNYLIHVKGHYNDYVSWKNPDSEDWSFSDILYYFQKAEQLTVNNSDHYSSKGSILFKKPSYRTRLSDSVVKAASEIGYATKDLNEDLTTGFSIPYLNLNKFGQRWTSDQYLKLSGKTRKNLKVVTSAVAEKILLRNNFEAYGVRFRKGGKIYEIFANQEIILSSGTVGSAKLLMLSGIGPKEVLSRAKVSTKINLPVGENLQDHITTGLDLIILNETIFTLGHVVNPLSAYSYFVHGVGPYTTTMCEVVGIIHSDLVNPAVDPPDLEFMVMMAGLSSDYGSFGRNSIGVSDKLWEEYFAPLMNESVITILPVLLHPKSVGEIIISRDRPDDPPVINPKYLSNEKDVTTLIKGIRIIQKIVRSKSMEELGAKFNNRVLPGCEDFKFDSDEYWKCYIKHLTLTSYHPVGTCKMGDLDNNGVVDHRLRLLKANRLRVIDASVMPTLPSGNTNAPVVMIAEKGADLIKEDYYNRLATSTVFEIFIKSNICQKYVCNNR